MDHCQGKEVRVFFVARIIYFLKDLAWRAGVFMLIIAGSMREKQEHGADPQIRERTRKGGKKLRAH